MTSCHVRQFNERLDYLRIYPWYSDDLIKAIKTANSEYETAIRDAYHSPTEKREIAVANIKFITFAVEIQDNCSDVNNTLCQKPNEDYVDYKFKVEMWMCYIIVIFLVTICVCFNLQRTR